MFSIKWKCDINCFISLDVLESRKGEVNRRFLSWLISSSTSFLIILRKNSTAFRKAIVYFCVCQCECLCACIRVCEHERERACVCVCVFDNKNVIIWFASFLKNFGFRLDCLFSKHIINISCYRFLAICFFYNFPIVACLYLCRGVHLQH